MVAALTDPSTTWKQKERAGVVRQTRLEAERLTGDGVYYAGNVNHLLEGPERVFTSTRDECPSVVRRLDWMLHTSVSRIELQETSEAALSVGRSGSSSCRARLGGPSAAFLVDKNQALVRVDHTGEVSGSVRSWRCPG